MGEAVKRCCNCRHSSEPFPFPGLECRRAARYDVIGIVYVPLAVHERSREGPTYCGQEARFYEGRILRARDIRLLAAAGAVLALWAVSHFLIWGWHLPPLP